MQLIKARKTAQLWSRCKRNQKHTLSIIEDTNKIGIGRTQTQPHYTSRCKHYKKHKQKTDLRPNCKLESMHIKDTLCVEMSCVSCRLLCSAINVFFVILKSPSKSNPINLGPLTDLVRLMRRCDLINKKRYFEKTFRDFLRLELTFLTIKNPKTLQF